MTDRNESDRKIGQEIAKDGRPPLKDKARTFTRRREQFRNAQRAHHDREKDTLHDLQKRADELESGVEGIVHAFFDLSKQLLDTKALENNLDLASALQEMTRECISLAEMTQMKSVAN
ncbi:uncharacterized protein N7511_001178 [Penicillium nucicola]|uniref:uncharacterized protein n=1 Tax=Penicillium nucicola TaxID=1850975 RepID=UPI00254552F5|nr:uncharacterized protein N7511_001178 [Penicillium nucicola]KAJ5776167.1 hypothetical protein N7511_001178 [Penicillium nucicola]